MQNHYVFSGGLTYKSKLDISYPLDEVKLELYSSKEFSVAKDKIAENELIAGYDDKSQKIFACVNRYFTMS